MAEGTWLSNLKNEKVKRDVLRDYEFAAKIFLDEPAERKKFVSEMMAKTAYFKITRFHGLPLAVGAIGKETLGIINARRGENPKLTRRQFMKLGFATAISAVVGHRTNMSGYGSGVGWDQKDPDTYNRIDLTDFQMEIYPHVALHEAIHYIQNVKNLPITQTRGEFEIIPSASGVLLGLQEGKKLSARLLEFSKWFNGQKYHLKGVHLGKRAFALGNQIKNQAAPWEFLRLIHDGKSEEVARKNILEKYSKK